MMRRVFSPTCLSEDKTIYHENFVEQGNKTAKGASLVSGACR